MLLVSTMEMRIRIHITIVLSLMTIVIVACVGPSTGLPRNYQAFGALDWDVPWNQGRYYTSERRDQKEGRDVPMSETRNMADPQLSFQQLEDVEWIRHKPAIPVKIPAPTWVKGWSQPEGYQFEPIISSELLLEDPIPHIPIEGQEFLDTPDYLGLGNMNEKANENSAGPGESNRRMGLYWGKDRQEASNLKDQYFPIWPDSTSLPASNPLTSGSRFPTFCQSGSPPSRPDTTKQTDPPKIPTKSTHPSKPTQSEGKPSNCRKKSRILNPDTAKVLLEIIMDTKQHVLSTLKILNSIESEVLGRSADDCSLHDLGVNGRPAPKKMPEQPLKSPTWKQSQSQDFSLGQRPTSQRKSVSEKLKQKERLWEEPQYPTPGRRLIIKNKYHGQKEQPMMKRVPPGMVAILC